MIINGKTLLEAKPIKNMEKTKKNRNGISYGLTEAGYDIRIKQGIFFNKDKNRITLDAGLISEVTYKKTNFTLASAIEEFHMPDFLIGRVHDKSTWARKGLSVFNTIIEPGWKGFLTLELVYHGSSNLYIPSGSGIAQVIFDEVSNNVNYSGKYQNQPNKPIEAKSKLWI